MRMILICDNCKKWNEFDYLRDKKYNSNYFSYDFDNMGLSIINSIKVETELIDDEDERSVKEIGDVDDIVNVECELDELTFKCNECGDEFKISI
ncbi:hypothetical protein EDC19_0428 [Natranaerovirga hydrolytica]|uniref:Uncharacterized protein n=1 Tax=Natranaerovirga hydrolytica TaxID=680378 RepID=A0A4R1MZL9_9FIRM|nr:hypothetical protein [Natranaerovirga hydrolytica]TCK98022.1 hypothetical protein EDC19_0428 [Natranaerovirga hydrolytica]